MWQTLLLTGCCLSLGSSLYGEQAILGVPSSLSYFYSGPFLPSSLNSCSRLDRLRLGSDRSRALAGSYVDTSRPRVPALAVASGSFIYIYRNFRPHYKFTVPTIEIDVEELKVWEGLAKCSLEIPAALNQLTSMRYVLCVFVPFIAAA